MRKNKTVSFAWILAGLIFFFNPTFSAIDVLPDFIGCLLVCFGLFRLSLVYAPLREVQKRFLKLAAVDAVKNILLIFVFANGTDAELPTSLLIVTFAAAVVELYLLLPAVHALLEGIVTLAIQEGGTALYSTPLSGRIARLSVAFLALRDCLCLLPEFSALFTSSYTDSGLINLYSYIGVMRTVACALVLLAGIAWIVLLSIFFWRIHRENDMRRQLAKKYDSYLEAHPGVRILARHFVAFLALAIGAFLTADFYLDFKNILPDALAAAFLLLGILLLDIPNQKKGIAAALTVAYGGVAFWSSQLAYRFMTTYQLSDIGRNDAINAAYRTLWLSSLLELFLFLALIAWLLLSLRDTVRCHAGYRPIHADSAFEARRMEELREEFDGSFLKVMLFAFFAGLLSFLYDYIKDIPAAGFFRILEFLWFFDMLASLVFASVFSVVLYDLYGQIRKKYQLDGISALS